MSKLTLKQRFISWFVLFLPPCDVITHQLSDRLEGRLTLKERFILRIHLWTCVWCTRYGHQIEFIEKAAREHGRHGETRTEPESRLSNDAKALMKEMLSQDPANSLDRSRRSFFPKISPESS